ncbi:MAG TPA: DUF2177 domain-containing protein [Cytophagales bacterium]|nr:DUF2177 domain-containing protein [Cytophagales bacterium]HCR53773.1 DUF2177 domain-containing protein [Cytophagales bacterium]
MPFYKLVIGYVLTTLVFFAIDLLWLGLLAKDLYKKYLGGFLSDQVNWTAAIVFYLLFIVGIFIFVILPAVEKDSIVKAIVLGALFGFFTYATYDLTNLATLKNWPITIVLIDIAWGSILTALVGAAGFTIIKWIS